jgi:hypothetical protein
MAGGHLGIGIVPLTELEELYRYAQAIQAIYERLGLELEQVGYPAGASETGRTSGGPGHGDPTAGQTGQDGGIRDAAVRADRAILKREAKWVQREVAKRTPRLYRELGWSHPNEEREREQGYREPDGRLRVVGG